MTRIQADLPAHIAQALRQAGLAARTELRGSTSPVPAGTPVQSRTVQLRAVLAARISRLANPGSLSDDEILVMAIQETLALEFGHDVAQHPKFSDVVERIRGTLSGIADTRALLGKKGSE